MQFLFIALILVFLSFTSFVQAENGAEIVKAEKHEVQKPKKCEDAHLVYKVCTDQKEILRAGLARAKNTERFLLLVYGFEECPWCHNLHQLFSKGELKSFAKDNFVIVDINIKEPSGKEVFLANRSDYKKTPGETGFPFLVVINPKTGSQAYLETGDLEDNTDGKGHDISKLKKALQGKIKSLTQKP